MTSTPSALSRPDTSADWARASARTLAYRRGASTVARLTPAWMPRSADPCRAVIMPEVAISVLEGTQSVRTHAPPRPSRSMIVTAAPSWAATKAAS
jgi:hypothetical protein